MLNKPELIATVRIRDKHVQGGARLINRTELTDNDVVLEDDADAGKSSADGTGCGTGSGTGDGKGEGTGDSHAD